MTDLMTDPRTSLMIDPMTNHMSDSMNNSQIKAKTTTFIMNKRRVANCDFSAVSHILLCFTIRST